MCIRDSPGTQPWGSDAYHPALDGTHQACPTRVAPTREGSFVTDTTTGDNAAPANSEQPRRSGALSAMRLAQLQQLASSMGITGTAKMRKSDLIAAIRAQQLSLIHI